ncbi:radical SAM protein [Bosea sp. BK604]|uniref:B12-binding domain-containing radical SAM protein n=1 Tax=Bosea sp. BK604 TaxID=2512180 RepID=UPI00104B3083|nr:radical SAM protein [Bosea sp. BK604]TCR66147.1 radical SAM superfamily enzyme YgiQ (UPF0313 family) [Bosea sp. BK604]
MQPIAGLHVAALIDPERFDITLYHEDWHGPFDPANCKNYDLVFLTGLQPDFDRMRQLSFHFRRSGATVVAGGSVCTLFPEYARQFFDAVCSGGVDSVSDVIRDYLAGALRPIYRSPVAQISQYTIDYSLLRKSGINPLAHLAESSRGCSFKCSFCVIPSEVGGHARYGLERFAASIENALETSSVFSLRRWYPMVMLLDNNFSDNRAHMLAVCQYLKEHPRIRGWGALVTQNVLQDRELIEQFAAAKCVGLFVGIESFEADFLRRYNKTQNLGRRSNVVDDIAFAESHGIAIGYGQLFDPRHQTAADMQRAMDAIADNPFVPMPTYLSTVAPLAGTQLFWEDLEAGRLAANLRFRDLDGETVCYSRLAEPAEPIVTFLERVFRRPWMVVGRGRILRKTLHRLRHSGSFNPMRWYIIASASFHCFSWANESPGASRTYLAGTDTLDPQYAEHPADISPEDRARYFEPTFLTDGEGRPTDWLEPYAEEHRRAASAKARRRNPVAVVSDSVTA